MPLKVRVQNYQSIEDAEIVLDGLTVITGTNNAGKSAFFRAIQGAFTNARGHAFVRHGTKHCTVTITDIETEQTLVWKKGKGINTYVVNGKEYPKVAHGLPPEADIFGVRGIHAGSQELWPQIATQLTGVGFLVHETGSTVAEAVADVDRVNQLSRALKSCESDRRSAKSDLKVRVSDGKLLDTRMEAFAGLEDVASTVEDISKKHATATKMRQAAANLRKLAQRRSAAKSAVTQLQGLDEASSKVPESERLDQVAKVQRSLQKAQDLATKYNTATSQVQVLQGLDEVTEKIPSKDRFDEVSKAQEALHEANRLKAEKSAVETTLDQLAALEGLSCPSDQRVAFVQKIQEALQTTRELQRRYRAARGECVDADVLSEAQLDEESLQMAQKVQAALSLTREMRDKVDVAKNEVSLCSRGIAKCEADVAALTEQLAEQLGEHADCPVCGGDLRLHEEVSA